MNPITDVNTETNSRELVVFKVADIDCGMYIEDIQEIKKVSEFTKVHHAPEYVMGVINLRGQIVTVISLQLKFGFPINRENSEERIIMVKRDDEFFGLLVDEVQDAFTAEKRDMLPTPANLKRSQSQYVSEVFKMKETLVAVLDKEKILAT